jgi:DNA polymerase-3 subunit delta
MPVSTPAAVRKQIASGELAPIYLILGEDEIEKGALATEFGDAIDEGLRAFNVERLHAGDWTTGDRLASGVATLLDAVRTLPMMADRRIVVVSQADTILSPKRDSEAAAEALDALAGFVEHAERQTTLVLVASGLDKRRRLGKLLAEHATIVPVGVLETADEAARWVRTRIAASGQEIDQAAARRLAERAGFPDRPPRPQDPKTGNLARMRAEVDRLVLYTLGQRKITMNDVADVGGAAEIRDQWALANAIESGRAADALRELGLMFDAGAVPVMILGQLRSVVQRKFSEGAAARLQPAVQALFRTDVALKSSGGDPRILLERLVVELCEGTRSPAKAGRHV